MRRTVAASIIVLFAACGRDSTPPPTVTTPAPLPTVTTADPQAFFSLRVQVFDTALRRVPQARIEVLDGPQAGAVGFTDDDGSYSFDGVRFTEELTLRASKTGHVTASKWVQWPVRGGDKNVPFTLESTTPPVNLVGNYMVALTADAACTDLPPSARSRTYAATVAATGLAGFYAGVLGGGKFTTPEGGQYDKFVAAAFGNFVRFGFWFDGEGPAIVDQVEPNTFVGIVGGSDTVVTEFPLDLPFAGQFMYCEGAGPNRQRFECTTTPITCNSTNHRLRLTRQTVSR